MPASFSSSDQSFRRISVASPSPSGGVQIAAAQAPHDRVVAFLDHRRTEEERGLVHRPAHVERDHGAQDHRQQNLVAGVHLHQPRAQEFHQVGDRNPEHLEHQHADNRGRDDRDDQDRMIGRMYFETGTFLSQATIHPAISPISSAPKNPAFTSPDR